MQDGWQEDITSALYTNACWSLRNGLGKQGVPVKNRFEELTDGDDEVRGEEEERKKELESNEPVSESLTSCSWPKTTVSVRRDERGSKALRRAKKEENERRERGRFMKWFYEQGACEDENCASCEAMTPEITIRKEERGGERKRWERQARRVAEPAVPSFGRDYFGHSSKTAIRKHNLWTPTSMQKINTAPDVNILGKYRRRSDGQ